MIFPATVAMHPMVHPQPALAEAALHLVEAAALVETAVLVELAVVAARANLHVLETTIRGLPVGVNAQPTDPEAQTQDGALTKAFLPKNPRTKSALIAANAKLLPAKLP